MKHFYTLIIILFTVGCLHAQTTVNYPQQAANYSAIFSDSAGSFDSGATEFGMWANGGGAKQIVAWRNFTEDGTTTGTTSTMEIGDVFTITVSATQSSYGQIGLALLSSPLTSTWDDRHSNYAVQVNLNGNSGANDPWEVVSTGGTINPSSIGGSTAYADFKFTFTLDSATTMTVSMNDGAETFFVTLNNTNITGYSIYFNDDWNTVSNANIYWKQLSEYRYAATLSTEDFLSTSSLNLHTSIGKLYINGLDPNEKFTLSIFDTMGRLVKNISTTENKIDISELKTSLYFTVLETSNGNLLRKKIIKR